MYHKVSSTLHIDKLCQRVSYVLHLLYGVCFCELTRSPAFKVGGHPVLDAKCTSQRAFALRVGLGPCELSWRTDANIGGKFLRYLMGFAFLRFLGCRSGFAPSSSSSPQCGLSCAGNLRKTAIETHCAEHSFYSKADVGAKVLMWLPRALIIR